MKREFDIFSRARSSYIGEYGTFPGRWGAIKFDPEAQSELAAIRLRRVDNEGRRSLRAALDRVTIFK